MSSTVRLLLSVVLMLFFIGAGTPGSASAGSWPATDGYPYYGQTVPPPFQWIPTTGMTAVNLVDGDEGYAGPFPIGFTFPFYNTTHTSFYVSANGYISFDANNQEPVNQCPIPDSDAPNNLIALMWGDLITANPNSSVFYKSYNNPPSLPCPVGGGKCLVVQYVNFNFYSGEKAGTFEAILYENGNISIQFLDVGPNAGRQSTTGIEKAAPNFGLTYACNTTNSLANSLAIQFKRNFLALTPEDLTIRGCNAETGENTFTLKNFTGGPGTTFNLSYNVTTGNASLTGPATVAANERSATEFEVTLDPPDCLPPGTRISATITAEGNNFTSTAVINRTLYQSGFWDDLPPEPEYCRNDIVAGTWDGKIWSVTGKGASNVRAYDPVTRTWETVSFSNPRNLSLDNYARSGCQHGSKVYFYGDTVDINFKGLWAFDLATSEVNQVSASGAPVVQSLFGPAWAYDSEAGLCYLTGGAESAAGNSRDAVYVFDPKTITWALPLSPMTTSRKLHAAFVFKRPDNHKLLCVAGGMNVFSGQGTPLSTTQCYDLTSGGISWNPQNADLGSLPGSWWGMGYTQRDNQLWLVSGVINGLLSGTTRFFDVNSGTWVNGGSLTSGPVFRNSAVALNGKIYKLGGLVDLTPICSADENMQCSSCGWWSDQLFLPLIHK